MRIYIPRTIGLYGFNCWLKSAAINCIINGIERGVFVYSQELLDFLFDNSVFEHRNIGELISENNGANYYILNDEGKTIEKTCGLNRVYFLTKRGELEKGILNGIFDLENYVILLNNRGSCLRWVRQENGVDYSGPWWVNIWDDFWKRNKAEPEFFEVYRDDLLFEPFDKRDKRLFEHPWIKKDAHFVSYFQTAFEKMKTIKIDRFGNIGT